MSKFRAAFLLSVVSLFLFPSAVIGLTVPEVIRVGLESGYSGVDNLDILNKDISHGYGTEAGRGQYGVLTAKTGFSVRVSDGRAVLYDGPAVVAVLKPGDNIAGVSAPINLGDRRYRGAVEFMIVGSKITAVNCLTIEEYLYSVVPSEMPQSWHIEALKAQVVASRSYSMTRLSAHRKEGYHFCDRVHCQSYLGVGNEAESTTTAVNATLGVLAYYDGAPINAVYSSSNGGHSSASEDVWTETVPYLRAVDDVFEVSGRRWKREFTLAQVESLLNDDIGTVTKVYIGKTAQSGHVLELVIEGTSGSKILAKEGIRAFFSPLPGGALESTNFVIQGTSPSVPIFTVSIFGVGGTAQIPLSYTYVLPAGKESVRTPSVIAPVVSPDFFPVHVIGKDTHTIYGLNPGMAPGNSSNSGAVVFSGSGWGHGAGMSQYGAKDMAEAGFNYVQILKHYYTGIEVG